MLDTNERVMIEKKMVKNSIWGRPAFNLSLQVNWLSNTLKSAWGVTLNITFLHFCYQTIRGYPWPGQGVPLVPEDGTGEPVLATPYDTDGNPLVVTWEDFLVFIKLHHPVYFEGFTYII